MTHAATAARRYFRRSTRATSEKVRASVEARAKSAPVVITGISPGKLVTVEPAMFQRLDVDPAYQRGETKMVNEIVRALQAGGKILDPVTLCRRLWDDDRHTLWIVDGYQRVCAHQQLGQPFQAMVHDSESLEAEKNFFLALNNRRAIGADLIIKAWTGDSGHLIARANTDESHPLCGRIHFAMGKNTSRLSASILAKGALAAATGTAHGSSATGTLTRLDHALKDRVERARAEHYLRLMGHVFPKGSVNIIVAQAIGLVAYERWAREVALPRNSVIEKLRLIQWDKEVPGAALIVKFRPVLVETVRRVWR